MSDKLLSTIYETSGSARAEIYERDGVYLIKYIDASGNLKQEEIFPGKSLHFVEDAADNWSTGIKFLKG